MNTEKMAARARTMLILMSLLGLLVLAASITACILSPRVPNYSEHMLILGAIGIGAGLIMTALSAIALVVLGFVARTLTDGHWRHDQFIGQLEGQRQQLEAMRESLMLSDAAKAVAYRAKDREALRAAIREEMDRQDFEAALVLVEDMDQRFGYHQEAEQLREQIRQTAKEVYERQVREIVDNIDQKLARQQWMDAMQEAARVNKFYAEHADIKRLPERIQVARDAHKRQLLKEWQEAVARDDVDRSVDLLKQLDQYLTPSEAEAYKDSAREVFRKRLMQLQAQFSVHVHDKNWTEALKIGQQIVTEFPNTRSAAEVKDKLPVLSERAQPLAVGAAV